MPIRSKIKFLLEYHDVNGLVNLLRDPQDPDLRGQAAEALGELDDMQAAEPLIRSILQDPDPAVQKTARASLENLIGSQASLAISAYRSGLDKSDPWLMETSSSDAGDAELDEEMEWEETEEDDESDEDADDLDEDGLESLQDIPASDSAQTRWDEENLHGLILVLSHESDPAMRLRAIRALKNSSNMAAIAALAQTSLWGDDTSVRQAAYAALKERFGDDADSVIESYREGGPEIEEPEEADEFEETEELDAEAEERPGSGARQDYSGPLPAQKPAGYSQHPPVIQEGGMPWGLIGIVGVGLLVVLGLILALSAH